MVADDDPVAGVTWDTVRRAANQFAADEGEWAGVPLPVDHLRLVMSPKYKFCDLNGYSLDKDKKADTPCPKIRNIWYSHRLRGDVVLFEEEGRVVHCVLPDGPGMRLKFLVNTIGGSRAWDFKAEVKAMEKLRDCVDQYKFERYVMTGTFLETSERSGVTYLFRRLRPTVAIKDQRILAALCMHPIGHYEESFSGVMVPTDDVLAHLLLMRADEHLFWKRANHHNPYGASSGI